MKKKYVLITAILAFVILIPIMIMYRVSNPTAITFTPSTQPLDELWESAVQVNQIKPVFNTPYVYLDALLILDEDVKYFAGTRKKQLAVINTQTQQKVLGINYDEAYASGDQWLHQQNSVYWRDMLNEDNQPVFIGDIYTSQSAPKYSRYIPSFLYHKYIERNRNYKKFFGMNGQVVQIDLPYANHVKQGKNRFYHINNYDGTIIEYALQSNLFHQLNQWNIAKCDMDSTELIPLREDYFIYFENCTHEYSIYSPTNVDRVQYFNGQDLNRINDPNGPLIQGHIHRTVNRAGLDSPVVIMYGESSGNYHYAEIHEDQIESNDLEDIIQMIGRDIKIEASMIMDQHTVLVEIKQPRIDQKPRLYIAKRNSDVSGELGLFETNPSEIVLPEFVVRISWQPYDDTHLLLYGKNALWTMKYDGSELMQIFPKQSK